VTTCDIVFIASHVHLPRQPSLQYCEEIHLLHLNMDDTDDDKPAPNAAHQWIREIVRVPFSCVPVFMSRDFELGGKCVL